jgi:leader peptidase (prepilin peptidase)/N-methyltransferase
VLGAGVFGLGLVFGSLVNLLVYRLTRGESVFFPRSHCDSCGRRIPVGYLIPLVGYIAARGRCVHCGSRVPLYYPGVEILNAALWSIIYLRYGLGWYTAAGWVFTTLLLTAALTDVVNGYIYDALTFPAIVLGLIFSALQGAFLPALAGMLALGGVYFLLALLSHGGLGGGDVKMALFIGAFGQIEGAALTFLLSALLGAAWVLVLYVRGKARRGLEIRFGVFLAGGAYLAYVYGAPLWAAYTRFLTGG